MSSPVVMWIWLCAYLNAAGWLLSVLHQLNKFGYGAVFALGLGIVLWWRQRTGAPWFPKIYLPRLRRRYRRAFPMAFLILAGLAFLGGALHGASNYDALAYRTPRVLHWLDAGQWQWIHTDFPRLNTRTAGFEWLTAPQFLFLRTDRFVFLLNVVAFLLLPGRVFAILTRLGVRPRTAWYWMWLFPSGYGYVLQAGSVVNDMFGAVIAFTAMEFALRASREKNLSCLWTSGLAAALMTAVKAFNMMLLLPWFFAAAAALPLALRRPVATGAVFFLAAGASMIPTAFLDAHYCGDWTGANIEQTPIGGGHELMRFVVNVPNLVLGNIVPPVFPFTKNWENLVQSVLPPDAKRALAVNFEGSQGKFRLPELQVEETSGLGCGLSLLLVWLLVKKIRAGELLPPKWLGVEVLVPLGAWVGVGVFMVRVGISGPARYLLPFYLFLFTPLLAGTAARDLFRRPAARFAAFAIFVAAAILLVVSPSRPLLPIDTVLSRLDAEHSSHALLHRAWVVYSVYGERSESFAPVLAKLPPDVSPLGFIGFDEPEAALWRPFGGRRVMHIIREDSPEQIRAESIKYALVSSDFFGQHYAMKFDDWLAGNRAEVVDQFNLRIHAGEEPAHWSLVWFN